MAFAAYIVVTLAWGIAYVLDNHTGLELLTSALNLRFEWPPIPDLATYVIQAVVLFAIAPFHIGRCNARLLARSRGESGRHDAARLVGDGGVGARSSGSASARGPAMVPVMVMFVLAGALFERSRLETAS